jgi:beta-glucanase (GH16 family)
MNPKGRTTCLSAVFGILALFAGASVSPAQNRRLVWADEFDGPAIDGSRWNFETGPTYETLHYFTDRLENAGIVNGVLRIIALRESYQGFNYTAALLKTNDKFCWRYGRIEARMKLPHTTGFVPGFWMLPQDDRYGFWPWGGEIDVMEHPTNQDRIFGTCHTWQYSYFTGSGKPAGGSLQIGDSETAFHVYAADWTPDRIDFYVDDQKYFTFDNGHTGFEVWPFDQPFYILLAMGVGGGWVGNPDATTVFPGVLEVDYVRVYQKMEDVTLSGEDDVLLNAKGVVYSVAQAAGAGYQWNLPNGAAVVSGQGTHTIAVDWGLFGGDVTAELTTPDGPVTVRRPVTVSSNLLKNAGFENGVKYWSKTGSYPVEAVFTLTAAGVHGGAYSLCVDVKTPGVNAWDAQLSQGNLALKSGTAYHASFWAKKDGAQSDLGPAILHATNYRIYAIKTVRLKNDWQQFEFDFTAPENATASFNIGMGVQTGRFYYDDFTLTPSGAVSTNQVVNADFSRGMEGWIFNAFYPAEAAASAAGGEGAVAITHGGLNTWDVYLGQAGVKVEKGKGYTVSFDAYASGPRSLFAFVGRNEAPWNVYSGNERISISTLRRTYSLTFTMSDPTDNAARLGFDLGASADDVFIDNVFLSMGSQPSAAERRPDPGPRGFQLFQNSPNPFNPVTAVTFKLPEAAHVTIEVYDINGRLVDTLAKSRFTAGMHSVKWNGGHAASGAYFYKMTANHFTQVRKMAMIR